MILDINQGGRGRLGDDLFLIAHDDYTGKAAASPKTLDPALAGALLGELALDGRIAVANGQVYIADGRAWQEPVADRTLSEIIHRGDGHSVRTWVRFLAPRIPQQIGERLVDAGVLRRENARRLNLRTTVRWPGIDRNRAAVPRAVLTAILERTTDPLDTRTAMLAALVRSGGVLRVLNVADRSVAERIATARRLLPPGLRDLLDGVDATIAASAVPARH